MKSNKKDFIILPQSSRINENENHSYQLALPLELPQKPQISSISGILPTERNRYRVVLGNRILGERLTFDEALELAKGGKS
jgi:hypothetical protein